MCAPDILIPIKSTNKLVYLAHLGTLKLVNFFKRDEGGRLIDHLHFELTDLKLNRARVAEDIESNDIEAEIEVIKPINFHLGKIIYLFLNPKGIAEVRFSFVLKLLCCIFFRHICSTYLFFYYIVLSLSKALD